MLASEGSGKYGRLLYARRHLGEWCRLLIFESCRVSPSEGSSWHEYGREIVAGPRSWQAPMCSLAFGRWSPASQRGERCRSYSTYMGYLCAVSCGSVYVGRPYALETSEMSSRGAAVAVGEVMA